MKPPLMWTKEQLNDTPSIKDGMSEADEKIERYLACQTVRDLIRDVFKSKEHFGDHQRYAVQILGCYYLQLFFMFQSMRNFDARGAVAMAAARLACKMYDEKPRGGTMYLELERQRNQRGLGILSDDEKKELRQQAAEIEIFLLRLTKFETDIALPIDEIDQLVEKALVKLSCASETFKKECGDKSPVAEAAELRTRIINSAKKFLTDGFTGLLPLRFSRRCASWSAILFALRYAVRKIPMQELLDLMSEASADDGIDRTMIEHGFQEIISVFKAKSQAERKAKAPPPAPLVAPVAVAPVAAAPEPAPAPPVASAVLPATTTTCSAVTQHVSAASAVPETPRTAPPPRESQLRRERSRSRDRPAVPQLRERDMGQPEALRPKDRPA